MRLDAHAVLSSRGPVLWKRACSMKEIVPVHVEQKKNPSISLVMVPRRMRTTMDVLGLKDGAPAFKRRRGDGGQRPA